MATTNNYFPKKSDSAPMIYAYEDKYDPQLKGLLKVGYTTIGVQERVRQQYNITRPGKPPYRILMNDAVYKFKRYEDASLSYAGIDRHESEQMVGGYSTVITVEEYQHQTE